MDRHYIRKEIEYLLMCMNEINEMNGEGFIRMKREKEREKGKTS